MINSFFVAIFLCLTTVSCTEKPVTKSLPRNTPEAEGASSWDIITFLDSGEASIGWLGFAFNASFYLWLHVFCGDMDICGWKRPQSYYRDALWKPDQLSIFVKSPDATFKINPSNC